ncbi:MAG: DUF1127 domain-containing protein [Arhodomonas sp.]|nr:DUF1127 domain-containing protein [Arhodomonas sp.]
MNESVCPNVRRRWSAKAAITGRAVRSPLRALRELYMHQRAAAALHALDDRMLHDIGVRRDDIRAVLRSNHPRPDSRCKDHPGKDRQGDVPGHSGDTGL